MHMLLILTTLPQTGLWSLPPLPQAVIVRDTRIWRLCPIYQDLQQISTILLWITAIKTTSRRFLLSLMTALHILNMSFNTRSYSVIKWLGSKLYVTLNHILGVHNSLSTYTHRNICSHYPQLSHILAGKQLIISKLEMNVGI